ncbi:Putative LOC100875809, partial [Caligus rogercresseyi]
LLLPEPWAWLGYKAHLMDCPFSTGFDRKLKICNFIQSLPRCRRRDSARTARYLSGELLPLKRGRSDSAVHVGQIGYLTSDELISSSTSLLNGGFYLYFCSYLPWS